MSRHCLPAGLVAGGLIAIAMACRSLALAQPPEGGDRPPPPVRGDAIRAALDVNGDHELDADEIRHASANLAKADRNGDGRIDHEEFRPPPPPRRDEGFRGPPPPREGGFGGPPPRPTDGEGPPREGPPGREGPPPPREDGPPREGPPFRDGAGPRQPGPPPEGGPSPERFVERALSFDADGDGKLDRAELEKFAVEVMQRMRGGPGPGPGRGPGDGQRPGFREGGDRPERPRRPE